MVQRKVIIFVEEDENKRITPGRQAKELAEVMWTAIEEYFETLCVLQVYVEDMNGKELAKKE